jgi:putative membrane protein
MASNDSHQHEGQERLTAFSHERTHLARERTILAHIRTGVSSFIFGTVLIGFFKTELLAFIIGSGAILLGVFFFVSGWLSYIRSNSRIHTLLKELEEPLEQK